MLIIVVVVFILVRLVQDRQASIRLINALIVSAQNSDEFSMEFQILINQIEENHLANSYLARRGITKSKLHGEMEAAFNELVEKGILSRFFETTSLLVDLHSFISRTQSVQEAATFSL